MNRPQRVLLLVVILAAALAESAHLFSAALEESSAELLALPADSIQGMIDQISQEDVVRQVGLLSGEWPILSLGQPYTISSRHTLSGESISRTVRYVASRMSAAGLSVQYHVWEDQNYPNVIGELVGQSNPQQIYLISAHLDSVSTRDRAPSALLAPGADDNASGTAAVLLAADVLSRYQWGCTLRFGLWTGEEQGLKGSAAYAADAADLGEQIAGVLNLDMIGYNSDDSRIIDLHARSWLTGSVEIASLMIDVVDNYNLNLQPELIIDVPLSDRSDNKSFWDNSYPAILAIEDHDDFNPYYHTSEDRLENMDTDFMTEFVKAGVAAFAHMGNCLLADGLGTVEGQVRSITDEQPLTAAAIEISDGAGLTATTSTSASGAYSSTLPAGSYTITVSANGFFPASAPGVSLAASAVAVQDFALKAQLRAYLPLLIQEQPASPLVRSPLITRRP